MLARLALLVGLPSGRGLPTAVMAVNAFLSGVLLLILNRCDQAGGEGKVKLAEALALRADANRRVEQLRARIVGSARFQEGEEPPEDAQALLAEAATAIGEMEELVRRINRTNAATMIGGREAAVRLRPSTPLGAQDASRIAGDATSGTGR